jgi:peptidoglycan/LPS O-acetylase OafA/YrhL
MAQQTAPGRSIGRVALSVVGATALIVSSFATWVNGETAMRLPMSSLYGQTFQHAPRIGIAVGAIMLLLGFVAILGLATSGIVTRLAGALAIVVFAALMIQLYAKTHPSADLPGIGTWLALIGGVAAVTGGT